MEIDFSEICLEECGVWGRVEFLLYLDENLFEITFHNLLDFHLESDDFSSVRLVRVIQGTTQAVDTQGTLLHGGHIVVLDSRTIYQNDRKLHARTLATLDNSE